MKIGVVGLGRLGMPLAVAASIRGHEVVGYDVDPAKNQKRDWPTIESGPAGEPNGFQAELDAAKLSFAEDIPDLCDEAPDLILVCVQTPHGPEYEGTTPLPATRQDFDYAWLEQSVRDVASALKRQTPVVVVSTVLPGTCARLFSDLPENAVLVYAPQFIAMGSVLYDFFHPEFWLMGGDDEGAIQLLDGFFTSLSDAPTIATTVSNAEAIKVFYNTYIGMKIVFANTVTEIAHKMQGAFDPDVVMRALGAANKRLMSPAYLRGGMGDGGACHPRDNIALSWLARKTNVSFDLLEAVMMSRERHARWLADTLRYVSAAHPDLPVVVLGYAYKPESDLVDGSPALLVRCFVPEAAAYDPLIGWRGQEIPLDQPAVFFLGCAHRSVIEFDFPPGSVVIDPFRLVAARPAITVIGIGRGDS